MFQDSNLASAFTSAGRNVYATTCSRWSSVRRIMGPPYPGNYGWKYHPWVREILDSKATYNVTLKSAQGGFTEIGINRALWHIDVNKKDVLYVLPTATNAGDFSKARFGGALFNSPYLKSIFTQTNTSGLKQAGATSLYIRGSRGDSNLKSIPAAVLFLDEFDEMDQRAVALALKRLSGQPEKEIWFISTPTLPNYGVSAEYLLTTQEHFTFKCPKCSRQTTLTPECLVVRGETINDPDIHKSYLKCKECDNKLDQEDKWRWLSKGLWTPTYQNGDRSRRGYHINQFYSSTVTPAELAADYIRGLNNEFYAQEWFNSVLGLPYVGDGAQLDEAQVQACKAEHRLGEPPQAGGPFKIRTMGIDQGNTSYYVIVEWSFPQVGPDINSMASAKVVDYGKFFPLSDGYGRIDELMREWQISFAVIDPDPFFEGASAFGKRFNGHVHMCRYRRGYTGKELDVDSKYGNSGMVQCNRSFWLATTLSRFKNPDRIQLPQDTSLEFVKHMTALVRRYEKDPDGNSYTKYVNTSDDHFAHALNYAEIALPFAASMQNGVNITKVL